MVGIPFVLTQSLKIMRTKRIPTVFLLKKHRIINYIFDYEFGINYINY